MRADAPLYQRKPSSRFQAHSHIFIGPNLKHPKKNDKVLEQSNSGEDQTRIRSVARQKDSDIIPAFWESHSVIEIDICRKTELGNLKIIESCVVLCGTLVSPAYSTQSQQDEKKYIYASPFESSYFCEFNMVKFLNFGALVQKLSIYIYKNQ